MILALLTIYYGVQILTYNTKFLIAALLLTNALSGEKETSAISASYGPPSSYGAPSYQPPPLLTHYSPPSLEYGAPSVSYKPSYHG